MRYFGLVVACLLLTGCVNTYQQFYKPVHYDAATLQDIQRLNANETPKILRSDNLDRDVKIALSKGYVGLGSSYFNGGLEPESALIEHAQNVGAVMVLVHYKFTETRAIATPLFLPNNQTTYSSGTAYGRYGSASYSGTSTTYGTTVVPMTSYQQRYDQTALFFGKALRKARVGVWIEDLPMELRTKLERNTGALITIVREDSPAFAADILPDDILIEFNGVKVLNAAHALEIMNAAVPEGGRCPIKILRNGTEREITLQLASR